MGYKTYHEMLDEDQAEQEAIMTSADHENTIAAMLDKQEDEKHRRQADNVGRLVPRPAPAADFPPQSEEPWRAESLFVAEPARPALPGQHDLAGYEHEFERDGKKYHSVTMTADDFDAWMRFRNHTATDRLSESIKLYHEHTGMGENMKVVEMQADEISVLNDKLAQAADTIEKLKLDLSLKNLGNNEFADYIRRQWAWSLETFGPAFRTAGIVEHIKKELAEIEKKPHDLSEWVDVVILALDGYWRHGGSPKLCLKVMQAKQDKNFARKWPDWRTLSEHASIEHERSED